MRVLAIIADVWIIISLIITMSLLEDARTELYSIVLAIIFFLLVFFFISSIFITIYAFKRR